MPPRKPRSNGIERASRVLEFLMELGESATAYQIAKRIGAPLSTTYETIALMEELGMLQRSGGEGRYFLGARLLFYGLAYSNHLMEDEVYRREAEALSRVSGENVQICVRDGDSMVVAFMTEGADHFRISSRPGSRTPLNWSASGRLLIGHLAPEEREAIFNRARPSPTGRAPTDPAQLEAACVKAWKEGCSVQIAESDFAVACIAAPVRNRDGECVATVSMVVPEKTAKKKARELSRLAAGAAERIEQQLGWRNHTLQRSTAFLENDKEKA